MASQRTSLPRTVPAVVIAPLGAAADVHELDGDVGALAVVGDREPHVLIGHDAAGLRLHFLEKSSVDAPSAVAVQRPEIGRAVARERFDVDIAQADRPGASHHIFDGVVKPRRGRHAMELREARHVILGRNPRQLVIERFQYGAAEQRLGRQRRRRRRRLRRQRGGGQRARDDGLMAIDIRRV